MKIFNQTKNKLIAAKVKKADTFCARLVGLLGRSALASDEGLLITRCQSIHMFFMRFTIDVIFVDKKDRVVGLVSMIKPFRLSRIFPKASYAIELAPGIIEQTFCALGDQLLLQSE